MRKAFSALMALMLVAGFMIGVGTPARAKQAASAGTVISDASGNPVAEISVDSITDPFEGYDASSGPQRGFRFVMVTVTITNTGDQPYQGYSYGLSLVDQDGFLATPTYVYRTDMSVPDLVTDPIEPGASITGALFYQVLSDAEIASIVFQPDYTQFYLLASNGDAPEAGAPVTDSWRRGWRGWRGHRERHHRSLYTRSIPAMARRVATTMSPRRSPLKTPARGRSPLIPRHSC